MHRKLKEKFLLKDKKSVVKSFAATLLLFFISVTSVNAQQKTITGLIQDVTNEPLLGVNISVKGTNKAAISDFDGNYSIRAKKNDIIVFASLGYTTQELKVFGNNKIDVKLIESAEALKEVVVIGYGAQKKKEVTGAVGSVRAEELAKTTTSDLGAAIQGQIAGVSVTASSGEPGAQANIVVRGYSSLQDGQNSPLYVVDGIPYDNDPGLSVNEIESIEVLKDAASASIYGTRASGGVVLITTKQGIEGKMKIKLNSEYGVQKITSNTPLLNTKEYFYVSLLQLDTRDSKQFDSVFFTKADDPSGHFRNTNLEETILNDLAVIQNHNLSISGGKKDLLYNFGVNYFNQEGVIFNSDFKRFNVRTNVKYISGKFKVFTGLTFRKDDRTRPDGNVFNQIFNYEPQRPAVDLSALEFEDFDGAENELQGISGILRTLKRTEKNDTNFTAGNIEVQYDLTKDLKITARGGANFTNLRIHELRPQVIVKDGEGQSFVPIQVNQRSSLRITDGLASKLTFEAIANYKKDFGKHSLSLLAVNSIEKSESERFFGQKALIAFPNVSNSLNNYLGFDLTGSSNTFTRTIIGYVGRALYNYDGKYLFSASIRRDGSSQFSKGNRWGWFPSLSAGWNISDEPFWDGKIKEVVNSFKLRGSYGTTGNDRFSPYQVDPVLAIGKNYVFGSNTAESGSGKNERLSYGFAQESLVNPNLTWETTIERNFGMDLAFFKNQFTLSYDYYISEKEDLLFPVVNPPSSGVSGGNRNTVLNVGNMRNKGLELAVGFKSNKGKFKWNTSLTYSKNENEVTKTSPSDALINFSNGFVGTSNQDLVTVITKGYEAGAFFMYKTDGVIKTQEELDLYKEKVSIVNGVAPKKGNSRFVDVNGDGKIDTNDRTYVGSGLADFEMGLNINSSYKNFDLSMQWFASYGGEVVNGSKAYAYRRGVHRDLFYAWSDFNQDSDIPQYTGANNNTFSYAGNSDLFLEDGSFLRLRNIALGYTIPKKTVEKFGISKFRMYVQAQNALTLTKYTGFNPEVGNSGLSTRGLDKGSFPITAQYKVGLQLQF